MCVENSIQVEISNLNSILGSFLHNISNMQIIYTTK